jgi:predicted Zn-dependent protease
MLYRNVVRRGLLAGAITAGTLVFGSGTVVAQPTEVKPGFNLFSREQEVQLGQQAAREAERQLPILRDANAQRYASEIISRLAQNAPDQGRQRLRRQRLRLARRPDVRQPRPHPGRAQRE